MDIKAILKKVANGEELTAEEKEFLTKYDPEGGEGRIPKARLDQEISKFKAEKERADKLNSELAELKEKLDELENSGKSEAEKAKAAAEKELAKLRKQVDDITKERDEAKTNFAKSERNAKISALAAKHNFTDSGYLDFLASSKKLDLDDEDATNQFMSELGKSTPQLFKSNAKSGGGTKGSGTGGGLGAKQRLDELMKKPELSTREAGEVIKLQQEIADADSGKGKESENKGE